MINTQLDHNGKLYVPVKPPSPERRRRSNAISNSMHLENTRERIYIHSLDEELSDTESDEERLIFLPDIEKRLGKIPKSILSERNPSQTSTEVVLYNVPESISIPREQDNVRKAIIESRERARAKQLEKLEATKAKNLLTQPTDEDLKQSSGQVTPEKMITDDYDEDPMDIE